MPREVGGKLNGLGNKSIQFLSRTQLLGCVSSKVVCRIRGNNDPFKITCICACGLSFR